MNKTKLLIIKFSLVILSLSFIHSITFASTLKMLTLNIHCYQDNWELRFNHILDQIVHLDPDIIAFQEVCTIPANGHSQIDFLRNGLLSRGYPVKTSESLFTHKAWDQFDEYLMMVSKKSASGFDRGLLPESLLQRGYIGLEINGIWAINIHLEFRSDNAPSRRKQLAFIHNRFKDRSHIIAGDFNSHPESEEQHWLVQEGYYSLFPGPTHTGADGNSTDRIDGFWLSPLIQKKTSSAQATIVLNQRVNGRFLSDHFGVLLEFY